MARPTCASSGAKPVALGQLSMGPGECSQIEFAAVYACIEIYVAGGKLVRKSVR